uniref:Uncharacterized protein n=1 Tax=Cyanistes caeruleus TaxID=156563 RepID=A0A8C0Z8T7_CYACU
LKLTQRSLLGSWGETHKVYRQKLEEVTGLQTACSSSIHRQKKTLRDLKHSLQRCKPRASPEEFALIQEISSQIKERQNVFFDMEAYLPKRNGCVLRRGGSRAPGILDF